MVLHYLISTNIHNISASGIPLVMIWQIKQKWQIEQR